MQINVIERTSTPVTSYQLPDRTHSGTIPASTFTGVGLYRGPEEFCQKLATIFELKVAET